MDQRVNGEPPPPPTGASSLDPPAAPGQVEQVVERRSKGENEDVGDGSSGKEEKKGTGRKREGHKGAVLELLIEGRCGSAGQQQLQISGKETNCPEGNVRLRIGLQAKRTKKPPKILESYVCKPTVRTYQRQGRGQPTPPPPPPRVDGGDGQQSKSKPAADRSARDQCSGLDSVQLASRQPTAAAAAASQAFTLSSSSSSSSISPTSTSNNSATVSTTASLPGVNSPGSRPSKQIPIKLAEKGEVNSSSFSDRPKKENLPSTTSQPDTTGQKCCLLVAERTTSASSSASLVQTYCVSEARNEGNNSKKHNGLVPTTKNKGQSKGKSSVGTVGSDLSSKLKSGKRSSSSSARPHGSSDATKELSRLGKSGAGSPCSPSIDPKQQLSPAWELSPAQFQDLDPFLRASLEKRREKERRAKRNRVRDKKSKRNVLEAPRALGEVERGSEGGEDGRKKRTEKKKQGKTDENNRRKADDTRQKELEVDGGNREEKRDGLSPDRTEEQFLAERGEAVAVNARPPNPDSPDKADFAVEQATGDSSSKSKEVDIARHTSVAPHPSSGHHHSQPHPSSCPAPSPRSPREQDSRPLKKRKARRTSWTKLVQRAQRAESQETVSCTASTTSSSSPCSVSEAQHRTSPGSPQSTAIPVKLPGFQQTDALHRSASSCMFSTSSSSAASRSPMTPVTLTRRRGRPKSHGFGFDEPHPQLSPGEYKGSHKASALSEFSEKILQSAVPPPSTPSPKKRGRPPKRPLSEDQAEVGDRQLKIRRLIDEMKKRKKKRRLHEVAAAKERRVGQGGRAVTSDISDVSPRSLQAAAVQSLAALSSSFGSRLGPQINVSKRGTIYMGKRRGRKPKTQTQLAQVGQGASQTSGQSPLFSTPSEVSLFSNPPLSHPFPSPSLTHSSGAQSPYSEGGLTEHASSSLLFSQPFSLPSPSSPCMSPRLPPSSSSSSPSLSPFVKKSCPCQGRHQFPFHQSSCKLLLSPGPPLLPPLHHHAPGSPACPKDAAPSPRSESHSEETLPSDSGIGTDNNSISERLGEAGAVRGVHRPGQGSAVRPSGGPIHPSARLEHPPPALPLCRTPRHVNAIGSTVIAERSRDRHRHRRRDYQCTTAVAAPSCSCLCRCSYPGHKCPHSDFYPCLGHGATKRQKNKHKKKHQQQLHMQDPEFLADLDDVIGQLGEIHIGRRSWARAGVEQGFEGGGGGGGRRHHHHASSSHLPRSNIFRINLNGYYSPHPASHPASYFPPPPPFYTCQPLHCGRKAERRQCGCTSNFQGTVDNLGFYSYHHLPPSYSLPSPHQQPHHAHFIINPARFHRRRSRLLREGGLGGDTEGDLDRVGRGGTGAEGGLHFGSGFTPGLSCGCERDEHKPKHKHRHRHCERDLEDEEELHEDEEVEEEEENGTESSKLAGAKYRSGFLGAAGSSSSERKEVRGGQGSVTMSRESPWIREKASDLFSAAAAAKSLSPSVDRYKHTALTSLGLGSTHLSSFGGGWGGLGQSWTKFGGLSGTGFQNSTPSFRAFNGEQRASQLTASEGEEKEDDIPTLPQYNTSRPQTHTNLFTSAALDKGGRGLRSSWASRNAGGSERSWRTEEPAWTERREAALQGDCSGHRGQQRRTLAHHSGSNNAGAEVNKRRPGRPRKHPLTTPTTAPTTSSSPTSLPTLTQPSAVPSVLSPDLHLPGQRRSEPDPGGDAAVAAAAEEELQAARKKAGRKRKHGDSPFHQSVTEDEFECDAGSECLGQWGGEQREGGADPAPPRKNFLRAGLYSDDYKTADPPAHSQQQQQQCADSVVEFTLGERDYSLLPAPIHVGKYLRLKRIHFQLPYDVMWLWQHNQLHRSPSVPLKRKRRYCRLKERCPSSRQTAEGSSDIASLFPHINMEPLTAGERSFVLQHHVFLVRNWKLVRDKQIQLRLERQRIEAEEEDEEGEEAEGGADSHIKSGP